MKGQVMLLTSLVLTGTLLAATTIAGLLMVFQIRQSADIGESVKAIMAADAGLEWELYKRFKDADYLKPELTNGAMIETTVSADDRTIKSVGRSGRVARALEASF